MRLGVDTGGTFTDFVLIDDDGGIRVHKVASTPAAPERAILQGLAELGIDAHPLAMVHGSTVATNAILEGTGARTAFITSHGFGDTLTIGRQARAHLYDLQPPQVSPPVPAELCLECGGRLTPAGETLEALSDTDVAALAERIKALDVEAVAISLLFSFVDDTHERRIEAAMPDSVFVSRSSAVLPEYREYERGIVTWLNARVGPVMQGYLGRLESALDEGCQLSVMQSSAGTVTAAQAGRRAVHLLLSGPAGGALGAAEIGRVIGEERLLTFDMGGTSTDVSLIAGRPGMTSEGSVGPYPVCVPMVDVHTIGAGGGSIAWVDDGGALQVGPQSAGADPGPACYGRGGVRPTVTDAHAVLGRLPEGVPLAGTMVPDLDAAHRAIQALADQLSMDPHRVAEGIIRIADEHMGQALRVISVARGEDPREYALFPFGGAGGLHVCALAQALGMRRAVFPVHAGVLSAFGMLAGNPTRMLSKTVLAPSDIDHALAAIEAQGTRELSAEGVALSQVLVNRSVDCRYLGQSHALEVDWNGDLEQSIAAFHAIHDQRYGHRLELEVEFVTARVRLEVPVPHLCLPRRTAGATVAPIRSQRVYGLESEVPVFDGETLPEGQVIDGPAIVASPDATLWLAPGWSAVTDAYGNLMLAR